MRKEDIGLLIRSAIETGLAVKGNPIAAKLAGPLLTRLMEGAADWFGAKNRLKFESWFDVIAATNQYASAEQTMEFIEDGIDQPWVHGPLEDAVRAIRDGIDEAALTHLAKLAAWQFRDKIPPDRWSRRAVRLLLDCDASMVEAIEHLVEHLPSRWTDLYGDPVRIGIGGPSIELRGKAAILPAGRVSYKPDANRAWSPHPLYPELFALLRAHQFATEEGGQFPYEGKMLIAKQQAQYLVRLFHGAVAASRFPHTEVSCP